MQKLSGVRRTIAMEAAKLLYSKKESDYYIAKKKAAQHLGIHYFYQKENIPSNKEVRNEINLLVHSYQNPKKENEDKYHVFKLLLLPLESIKGGAAHPEGDMLYHSLQVFELSKKWHSYDVEFLQAALLHDVGKAIDPQYHAESGAYAIKNFVSERVFFLVRFHSDAQLFLQNKIGHKNKLRLKKSDYFEDLIELAELNKKGREPGAIVNSVDESLVFLRELEQEMEKL